MTDLATLGLQIDSRPLKQGTADLHAFAAAGRSAETAARGVEKAAEGVGAGAGKASGATAKAAADLHRLTDYTRNADGALSRTGASAKLTAHQMQQLSFQVQDVVAQVGSGTGVMQVMMQQGGQITSVFGDVRETFSAVGAALTPVRLAFGGIATALLGGVLAAKAYADGQKELQLALTGVGRGAGVTASQIDAISVSAARLDRMSNAAARSTAAIFAGTGKIDSGLLRGLTETTALYALQTGQDQKSAATELSKAFVDPSKGAEMLDGKLGILNDRLREYIKNAEASGDRGAAQKALLEGMAPALARATEHTNAFGKAWNYVWNMASNAAGAIGKALTGSQTDAERLASVVQQRQNAENSVMGRHGRNKNQIEAFRQQELEIQERMRVEQRRTAMDAERQNNDSIGKQAGEVIRSVVDDIARLDTLRSNKSLLERVVGDPAKFGLSEAAAKNAAEALGRVNTALSAYATATEKARQDGALQLQQINAYTLAERAAVESQRAYMEAIRNTSNTALAAVEAENARNRVIAEANRQARDMLRDAKLDAKLVGLSPYERGLQQRQNDRERWMSQNSGSVQSFAGPQVLDLKAFADSGRAAVEAYTRAAAIARGIDPEIAARVLKQESGFNAAAKNITGREESYGPMQLNAMGGLGAVALARGIDIRNPATWRQQIDFGMDVVARDGWRQWYGARDVGIGRWDGIGGARGAANDNGALRASSDGKKAYEIGDDAYKRAAFEDPLRSATLAIDAQEKAMSRLRQTIGATPQQQAALNAEIQLYQNLIQSGVPLTADQERRIRAYGIAAGEAAEKIRQIQFAQKQLDELKTLERDVAGGFMSDIVNGLRRGENGWKAFANAGVNALNKIADTAIKQLLDQAFFNQPGGGFFGALFKGLFGGVGGGMSLHSGGFASTGMLYAAKGYAFDKGEVVPFANGGIFNSPHMFPMAGGKTGLMGEAGPEAIIPLRRGADGKLGVQMAGSPSGHSFNSQTIIHVAGEVSSATIANLRQEMDRRDAEQNAKMRAIVGGENYRSRQFQSRFA